MDQCLLEHKACKVEDGVRANFLPARLIDVHNVRLVQRGQMNNMHIRYAALSHSWGLKSHRRHPIPKLRKENIADREKRIEWAELTKVFQDAIIVARRINIDYLWIDSLCIVQDDDEDWAMQSSQMANIYGSSAVVISATRAATGDVGIFHHRGQGVAINNSMGISVRRRPTHANFFTSHKPDFTQDPLFERGWCFQERLLAKRIIHFTEQETIWECSEELWCECQSIALEATYRKEGNHAKDFKSRFDTLLRSENEWERNSCWLNILEGYTARKLTYETDRLPALSGLAQQIATPTRGRYLAGMWEGDLPNSLLWYLPFMNPSVRQKIERQPCLPSWAWPSVGTAIIPHFENSRSRSSLETIASVLKVECTPTTSDLFGQVSGGYLVLEAPTMLVTLEDNEVPHLKSLVSLDDANDRCRFIPDSFTDLPVNGSEVLCTGIEHDRNEGRTSGFLCLVLRPVEASSEYRRIGQANCKSQWLAKAKKMVVRIH